MNHSAYLPEDRDIPLGVLADHRQEKAARRFYSALAAHPNPNDPEYPEVPEDDEVGA